MYQDETSRPPPKRLKITCVLLYHAHKSQDHMDLQPNHDVSIYVLVLGMHELLVQ